MKEPVRETGWIIADKKGRAQLHTLRSNPSKAWEALAGHKVRPEMRKVYQRQGFRAEQVWIESYRGNE